MDPSPFTATLLRTSAGGFAAVAVSRTVERTGAEGSLQGSFDAWQAHFRELVLELAAAVADGSREQFAAKVGWARDAFIARGQQSEILSAGLEDLSVVLEESLPSEAWQPLPAFFEAARQELERPSAPAEQVSSPDDPLDELAGAYLTVVREGDARRAMDVVTAAIRENRLSVPDALDGVLTRALREIGNLWHANELNIAEEHFASQTTGRLLEQLLLLAPDPTPLDRTVLLTMVEGDAHDLGLRIVAGLFELDGWRTICLGANTPASDLALAAETFEADLVVVGATLNTQRDAAAQAIRVLKGSRPEQKVIVGGPAFAALEGRPGEIGKIGASGCAVASREAVRLGRELTGV